MRLTREGCRQRQKKLVEILEEERLDGAVISRREHVYYLTGFLHSRYHAAALFLDRNGRVTLVGADVPEEVAADEIVPYEAGFNATMHSRQFEAVAEKLRASMPGKKKKLGADMGGGIACVAALAGEEAVDLTRALYQMRKRKLPDEVDAIRAAVGVTEVMYAAAKQAIHPGADEIEVFAHVRAEATRAAGEDLEHFGNDFRANDPGGAPRRRRMAAGELYILDAGPSLHGYFADNCRTFSVDRSPTERQIAAWERIDALFPILEEAVRPGMAASELFRIADEYLRREVGGGLVHHLGHGIGLAPHESPQLNPAFDAVFEVGDLFTMEPGVYSEELKAGIRLEENYLLTEEGLEKLTSFPRSLI